MERSRTLLWFDRATFWRSGRSLDSLFGRSSDRPGGSTSSRSAFVVGRSALFPSLVLGEWPLISIVGIMRDFFPPHLRKSILVRSIWRSFCLSLCRLSILWLPDDAGGSGKVESCKLGLRRWENQRCTNCRLVTPPRNRHAPPRDIPREHKKLAEHPIRLSVYKRDEKCI